MNVPAPLSYLPAPYPEETLRSLVVRYALRTGSERVVHALPGLFGEAGTVARYDGLLPDGVGLLASRTDPMWGISTGMLCERHTLLPYLAAFASPGERASATAFMTGAAGTTGRLPRGLLPATTSQSRWSFCPLCARRDRDESGEAYEHRIHQVPGIRVCPEHGAVLAGYTDARETYSLHWRHVGAALEYAQHLPDAVPEEGSGIEKALAIMSRQLLERPTAGFPRKSVTHSLRTVAARWNDEFGEIDVGRLFTGLVATYGASGLFPLLCGKQQSAVLSSLYALLGHAAPQSIPSPRLILLLLDYLQQPLEPFLELLAATPA